MRRIGAVALALTALAVAGCGSGSSGGVRVPTVAAARVFSLARFTPVTTIRAGQPTTMSFNVREPSGATLTSYRTEGHPALHAIQAAFVHVDVTDPHGAPVHFRPWFAALAHAIFLHVGSLDYFHTHVCAAGAANCSSLLAGSRVTGRATAPAS